MEAKTVSQSRATIQHQVLPNEINGAGQMHGGELLRHLDAAAAICAFRHARCLLVTAAIEHMDFIAPVFPGDILLFHVSANAVKRTSMEVGIRIEAEDYLTGNIRHVCTSYITFVGIEKDGTPRPIPKLIAETPLEQRRMADALRRMAISRMSSRRKDSFTQYLNISISADRYAICHLPPDTSIPPLPSEGFMAMSRSQAELTLVIDRKFIGNLPANTLIENDYACLTIGGDSNMHQIGILASLGAVLAASHIPIFSISARNFDYIFVQEQHLETAANVLSSVGHSVEVLPGN